MIKFNDQLVDLLGPAKAQHLIYEAERFASSMVKIANKGFTNKKGWIANEGGYRAIINNLCCHALLHEEPYDGFREYWNMLHREYRYDNRRPDIVSLDVMLEVLDTSSNLEEASSRCLPLGEFALSEYASKPQNVVAWLEWLERKPEEFQNTLACWAEVRSHVEVAKLCGVSRRYSEGVYREAKSRAIRTSDTGGYLDPRTRPT